MALTAAAPAPAPAARARALPARAAARASACPAVVTVHDLSFERDPCADGPRRPARLPHDRAALGARAPRACSPSRSGRGATCVELYGTPDEKIVVTPNAVDPAFSAGRGGRATATSSSSARSRQRKDPLAAADAAAAVGLPLVVVGPEKEPALARELERRGARPARLRRPSRSSRRSTGGAAGARPARRATRASACPCSRRWRAARPSSPRPSRRCGRSPATPRSTRSADELADGGAARARRARAAPRRRARARAALLLGRDGAAHRRRLPRGARRCEGRGGRRLARPRRRARAARCRRSCRRSTRSSSSRTCPAASGAVPDGVRVLENPRPLGFAANVEPRHRRDRRASSSSIVEPGRGPRAGRASPCLAEFARRAPALRHRRAADASTPTARGSRRAAASRPSPGRSCAARRCGCCFRPIERQRAHYHLDERPTEPVEADWMLGALPPPAPDDARRARRLRPAASGSTARTSTSATAPRRPAGSAGTCRARS